MKVLIVGSGGREHALAWKIARSSEVRQVLCLPGNGGTATVGANLDGSAESVDDIACAAREHRADLVVVGPEVPLVAGAVDRLRADGVAVFGPTAAAARLEGSKAFSKRFLERHGIPTAAFRAFDDAAAAREILAALRASEDVSAARLIRADGRVLVWRDAVVAAVRRLESAALHERDALAEAVNGSVHEPRASVV